jgi:muramoyltetrapeptide carboxypeptidase LdcA involved in peptidoglycan recycling
MQWLTEHHEVHAADLMEVPEDPTIQDLVSTNGSDDSIRMLPFLDYSVIRDKSQGFPRPFRLTFIHFALLKAGVILFYGPSLMAGFDENTGNPQASPP